MHTYLHTYAYTHTYTHTHTHIHLHTHTLTQIHIHTHTHTHKYIHTYTYTHVHILIHGSAYIYVIVICTYSAYVQRNFLVYWWYTDQIRVETFASTEFKETSESFHALTRMSAWERFTGCTHQFFPERECRYLVCDVSKLQVSVLLGSDFTLLGDWYLTFREYLVVSCWRFEMPMNLFLLLSSLSLFVQSGRVPFLVRGFSILLFLCFPICLFFHVSDPGIVMPRFPLYLS
jgi:hypothetical protein